MVNPTNAVRAQQRASAASALAGFWLALVALGGHILGLPAAGVATLLLLGAGVAGWGLYWCRSVGPSPAAHPCLVSTRTYARVLTVVDVEPTGLSATGSGRLRAVTGPVRDSLMSAAATAHVGPGRRMVLVTPGAVLLPLLPARVVGRRPLDIGAAPDKPR